MYPLVIDFTSPFDATVVDALRKSGADIVGKTNCDEFGMGCVHESLHSNVQASQRRANT